MIYVFVTICFLAFGLIVRALVVPYLEELKNKEYQLKASIEVLQHGLSEHSDYITALARRDQLRTAQLNELFARYNVVSVKRKSKNGKALA